MYGIIGKPMYLAALKYTFTLYILGSGALRGPSGTTKGVGVFSHYTVISPR